MHILPLDGVWTLRDADAADAPVSAPVPGSVHDALLAAGRIPDAHDGYGERDQLWVGSRTWIYAREIDVSADVLAADAVDLVADGLDTLCTIRINGAVLATTDNMFRRWRFNAAPLLRPGRNEIELVFAPADAVMKEQTAKRHLPAWNEFEPHHVWGPIGRGYVRKQACQFGWDWGPQCPSAGPWMSLRLEAWTGARIEDWRLEQTHRPGAVDLALYVKPNTAADGRVRVRFLRDGVVLAEVEEEFWGGYEWRFSLENPALWWPNGMGAQTLHTLEIALLDAAGAVRDTRTARIGLRQLELVREPDAHGRSFYFRVNGRPFFAKGSNWIPIDSHASGQDLEPRYRRDLESARDAHMNMLRVWGGGYFSHDVFYDLCDELGILVWQDLMFGCGTYPTWDEAFLHSVWRETLDQAQRLRHHACLACWCGNNELEQGLSGPKWVADADNHHSIGRMAWASYSELFERVLPAALTWADPATPYFRGSPHCAPEDGRDAFTDRSGDLHTWEIWFSNAPFENYRKYGHRFVSEFGFQSFPAAATLRAFAPEGENLAADSAWLEFRQRSFVGIGRIVEMTRDWFGTDCAGDFDRFCVLSQLTQGLALKVGIEHWRRRFPVCGGATYWQLNDRWAAPTWSTLEVTGRWKASHHLTKGFFAPVLVMGVEDREAGTVEVIVVNDGADALAGEVAVSITDCAGVEISRERRSIVAAGGSAPTVVGVFAIGDAPREDRLGWLQFESGEIRSENLVLFARPREMQFATPEISAEPTGNGDAVVRTGAAPALWVHSEAADGPDEFFHLAPHASRIVRGGAGKRFRSAV